MSINVANPLNIITRSNQPVEKSINYTRLPTKECIPIPQRNAYVEVYLFCPHLDKHEKKNKLKNFFKKTLPQLDKRIVGCPVFLNEQSALQYSRFMGDNHVIVKAFVPEAAIEGRSQALVLKSGVLTQAHVHGCYPACGQGVVYYENPAFDQKYFTIL